MKILDRLFKTKNAADLSEWYKLADFLGIDKNMNDDERVEATYYACLKILSEAVGKLPLIPLDYSQLQIWYDDGKLLSDVPDVWDLYSIGGKTYKFSSEEVLHFKSSITDDGIEGLSVREILHSTIVGNKKAQAMQNALYDRGFTAKAVVQYTGNLKDESVKNFLQNIEKYAKGEVDAGKGLVPISLGTQLTSLTTKLGDNSFTLDYKSNIINIVGRR